MWLMINQGLHYITLNLTKWMGFQRYKSQDGKLPEDRPCIPPNKWLLPWMECHHQIWMGYLPRLYLLLPEVMLEAPMATKLNCARFQEWRWGTLWKASSYIYTHHDYMEAKVPRKHVAKFIIVPGWVRNVSAWEAPTTCTVLPPTFPTFIPKARSPKPSVKGRDRASVSNRFKEPCRTSGSGPGHPTLAHRVVMAWLPSIASRVASSCKRHIENQVSQPCAPSVSQDQGPEGRTKSPAGKKE